MAYATIADIRALPGMDKTTAGQDPEFVFSDTEIQEAIDAATELFDSYTGTSFEHKVFSVQMTGNGKNALFIGVMFPRTLTAVTVDGSVVEDTTGWDLQPHGVIVRTDGKTWPRSRYGNRNVSIVGTAGFSSSPPDEIVTAFKTYVRHRLQRSKSGLPINALTYTSAAGEFEFHGAVAQAGGPGRPTDVPEVNAVLNRHKHKPGHTGSVIA